MSEIVAQVAPSMISYAVLSGPSHAEEVILRMPTTVVCASLRPQHCTYSTNSLLHSGLSCLRQ
ncbi:MAG: hypothetical protein IPF79_06085 [Ignavibacteria bacterium]|nr:hypothetical protein [Ignavibacteria bacterium]